jgi:transposase
MKQFGKSSEKISAHQLEFFDEVESESLVTTPEDDVPEETNEVEPYKRRRGKRLKLPEHLPREEVIIDIENKICPNEGAELKYIGDEVSEKLDIIPAQVKVIRTIRRKYACTECESINVAKTT